MCGRKGNLSTHFSQDKEVFISRLSAVFVDKLLMNKYFPTKKQQLCSMFTHIYVQKTCSLLPLKGPFLRLLILIDVLNIAWDQINYVVKRNKLGNEKENEEI